MSDSDAEIVWLENGTPVVLEWVEKMAPYVVEESDAHSEQRGEGSSFTTPKGGRGPQSWTADDIAFAAPTETLKLNLCATGAGFPTQSMMAGSGFPTDTRACYSMCGKQAIRCAAAYNVAWKKSKKIAKKLGKAPDDYIHSLAWCYVYRLKSFKRGVAKYYEYCANTGYVVTEYQQRKAQAWGNPPRILGRL
eukprot:g12110.t1